MKNHKRIILELMPEEIKMLAYGAIPKDLKMRLREIAYHIDDQNEFSNVSFQIKKDKNIDELTITSSQEEDLFKKLKDLRREIAQKEGLPPFMIFHNKNLVAMVKRRPRTKEEILEIKGMGQEKFRKYGYKLLDLIKKNL